VEDDDLAVRSQPHIAFDPRAVVERGTKGGHAVFWNARSVEPAMREALSTRVERVSRGS
jgi:hypothetical protein